MTKTDRLLGEAPIGKSMLTLALPALAANLINCLYSIVDRIFIGRIPEVGTIALTGVGITFPLLTLATAFASLAGSGGAPLVGIRLGEGDKAGAERIMGQSLRLLILFGFSLMAIFELFCKPLLVLFGASSATLPYGMQYLSIYMLGNLFVQLAVGLNPFISSQGRSGVAMLSVLVGAVLNIILDPIFIFTLGLGVRGAAWASVISQGVSAAWVVGFLASRHSGIRLRFYKQQTDLCKKILSLGAAPFIMGSTGSLVSVALNSQMQHFGGDLYVGSITILQSIMQLLLIPSQSVSYGTQPLVSYSYGAGKYRRVWQVFWRALAVSMACSLTFGFLAVFFSGAAARLFTDSSPQLVELCGRAGRVFFAGITIFGAQVTCQACFVALGQARASRFSAMLRKVYLMVPLIFILPRLFGGDPFAVYWAEPISDAAASITTFCLFMSIVRSLVPQRDAS